jgi:hypothetical protein
MQSKMLDLQQPTGVFEGQARPFTKRIMENTYHGLETPLYGVSNMREDLYQNLTLEDKMVVEHSHKYFVFLEGTLQRIRKGGKNNQLCIPEARVPMYLFRIHGETKPHLAATETWKAVATGGYWWPTWGADVCNHLRGCKTCTETKPGETHPVEKQSPVQQESTHV